MERVPKSRVTLRCRMERGDVFPAGLFVRRLFEFYDCFISGSARSSLPTLSSLRGSDFDVDGVVTWRTTGTITSNFF
ncbi:uncharacterized protein TNCV_776131 [Trichonephila clavipes]|nr:uncharacterized protein TNCV_776131 [Trichonephila clavipes]